MLLTALILPTLYYSFSYAHPGPPAQDYFPTQSGLGPPTSVINTKYNN